MLNKAATRNNFVEDHSEDDIEDIEVYKTIYNVYYLCMALWK